MNNRIINLLMKLKMSLVKQLLLKPLMRKTHFPLEAQHAVLLRILKKNQNTRFGRDNNFSEIRSYNDYLKNVPVCNYEDLRGYIEKQASDNSPWLNYKKPVMYAQTSGTTGKPKYIPILKPSIRQYKRSQNIAAYSIFTDIPNAFEGKVLAIISPAVEGMMETGDSFGAMSGLIYQSMPAIMRKKYVLPPEVFKIKDYERKYFEIAKYAMAERNVTLMATANPSTLIKLDKVIYTHTKQLIGEVQKQNLARAKELVKYIERKGKTRVRRHLARFENRDNLDRGKLRCAHSWIKKKSSRKHAFCRIGISRQ